MARSAALLTALLLLVPTMALAQSRGPVIPTFSGQGQSQQQEVAPAPAPQAQPEDSLDLVGPTDAQKARAEAVAKQRAEAEAKAKLEAEQRAKAEAEAKIKAEAEAKARAEAEQKAKIEAEARAKAEEQARLKAEAEAKARAEAEAKARAQAEAQARAEAEAKAKAEAAAQAKLAAEQKARDEAEAKARTQAEQKAQAAAAAQARSASDEQAKQDAIKRAGDEAAAKAAAELDEKNKQAQMEALERTALEQQVRAELEAKVKAEVEARMRAKKQKEIAKACKGKKGKAAKACEMSLDDALAAAPVAPAKAPAATPAAAAAAPAPAPAKADKDFSSLMASAPSDGSRRVVLAGSAAQAAPPSERPAGVRVAASSPVAVPSFDQRSSRLDTFTNPNTQLAIPSDEGGRRRSRKFNLSDDLQVGPQGLVVNQLRASGEVAPAVAVATFSYRFVRDDAAAGHHGFFIGAESPACDADGPCGLRLWANLGFMPNSENSYLIDRAVSGSVHTMADHLGWSSVAARAGLGGRFQNGFGLGGEAQLQTVSLDYTRNVNSSTDKTHEAAQLNQVKLHGTLSYASGSFELLGTIGGNLYAGGDPATATTGMPMRGVFLDAQTFGLASAPQGFEMRLEGRKDFAFGLSASIAYQFQTYAGEEWKNANLIGARLSQKIGVFDLGLGLVVQLDAPAVLPQGASAGDYSAMYGMGTVGATF
ncbi:MAG: hypothetical protein JST92_14575 [Deltaproteobacteria bacterium]|nr:hypothetical protein [Deltaproteobacteria bacterium]